MKYSKWIQPQGRFVALVCLLSLLTACGGGSGSGGSSILKNNQSNISTGDPGTGQGTLNCQSQPGSSDVCAQAPSTSQGSGGASNGITADNAAHVANAILGVITDAFSLGGINGLADSLVTATQSSYRPSGFDLPSFAMQMLIRVNETASASSNTVVGLLDKGGLKVSCDNGATYSQDTTTTPGAITVDFPQPDPTSGTPACAIGDATLTGQLTISNINVSDANNYAARFSFTNFTVQINQRTLELTGSMDFSTTSSDAITGSGQIKSVASSQQSNNGGSLGITVNGETFTLTSLTIDYTFDLTTNTDTLDLTGSISSSIPGAPFAVSTPTPLVKAPPPSGFSSIVPGPFAGGSLRLVASDSSSLTLDITSAVDDVALQVNGTDLTPISWATLLDS